MAEALAAIGLISATVQFIDFATKVNKRVQELKGSLGQVPKTLQDVRNRIPLMVDLMKTIRKKMEADEFSFETRETMQPVIDSCLLQIRALDDFLEKATSKPHESAFARSRRALSSVMRESELEKIDATLKINFDLLVQTATLHAITKVQSNPEPAPSLQSLNELSISPPPYDAIDARRRSSGSSLLNGPKSGSAVFMVPFARDPKFLGRQQLIEDIQARFEDHHQIALAGLGGVGKSQIAIEYCYVFRENHPEAHVFWVYAGSRSRVEQGYTEIARRLDLPGFDDPRVDTMQLVYSWLDGDTSGNWLLVVDNADDATLFFGDRSRDRVPNLTKGLAHYLPKSGKGSILVTTRDKRVGEQLAGREKPIEVLPMSAADAKALLLTKIGDDQCDEVDAHKLIAELANLPLAITQAAAFISENMLSISEYLELLAAGDMELQELLSEHLEDPRRDLDTENSVIRTWKLSFDQLLKGKPRAAEMLSLMSVLDYNAMPKNLLKDDGEAEIGFRMALGALQAFSLISSGKSPDTAYKMHRLVAVSTQRWLEIQGTLSFWQQQALKKLAGAYPGRQSYEYAHWSLLETLTPHAQVVFSFTFSTGIEMLQCATLMTFSALFDLSKGKYEAAYEKALKSMEIRTKLLPSDDPLILDSVQTIGEAQLHLGYLEDAKGTLQRAVAGRTKHLGKLAPDTLESLSDLTITFLELDDLVAAEETALAAYDGRRKVLGDEHADTIVSLNILSMLRQRQGDLQAANEIGDRVLKLRVKSLGRKHPETMMTLNNMAVLRYRQGQLDVAENMLQEVLAGEERLLGPECFDRQVSLTTLAFVRAAQGALEDAEELHKKVLAIRQKIYGETHPATKFSARNVQMIAKFKQQDPETRKLNLENLAIDGDTPPTPTHPGALLTSGLLFD